LVEKQNLVITAQRDYYTGTRAHGRAQTTY